MSMAKPKANAFLRKNRELGRGRTATLYPGSGPAALVGERPVWSLSRSHCGSRRQVTRGAAQYCSWTEATRNSVPAEKLSPSSSELTDHELQVLGSPPSLLLA